MVDDLRHRIVTLSSSAAGVSLALVVSVGVSATSTVVVARLCGPEVRGVVSFGLLWLVFSQTVATRGANTLALRALLTMGPSEARERFLHRLSRRLTRDVPIVASGIFVLLWLGGKMEFSVAIALVSAAPPVAMFNWTTAMLQSRESFGALSAYRLVGSSAPQAAQVFAVLAGVRSAFGITACFSLGSWVGHLFAGWLLKTRMDVSAANFTSSVASDEVPKADFSLSSSLALTVSGLLTNVSPRVDLLYLGFVGPSSVVGKFSIAVALTQSVGAVSAGLAMGSFRRGASKGRSSERSPAVGIAAASVLCAVGGYWLLVPLAGTAFGDARMASSILCVGAGTNGLTMLILERWRGGGFARPALLVQVSSLTFSLLALLFFSPGGKLGAVALASVSGQVFGLLLANLFDARGSGRPPRRVAWKND